MKNGTRIKRIIFTVLLLAVFVLAAVLMFGGEGIRWFGEKSEEVGESIRESTDEIGDRADELKEDMEDTAGRIKKDVKKKVTGE